MHVLCVQKKNIRMWNEYLQCYVNYSVMKFTKIGMVSEGYQGNFRAGVVRCRRVKRRVYGRVRGEMEVQDTQHAEDEMLSLWLSNSSKEKPGCI